MPQKMSWMPVLIGAGLLLVTTYLALALGMTMLLLLPPLITCAVAMTIGPSSASVSALLSGLLMLVFLDPISAAIYTLTGGMFGLLVFLLSRKSERIEVVVVLMGMYLASVYFAFTTILQELMGIDFLAMVEERFVAMWSAELAPIGVNAAELFRQVSVMSLAGIFALGGFLTLWTLYSAARLAASRGHTVKVPSFLNFRMRELRVFPILTLFSVGYLLSWMSGSEFWLFGSNLLFILLFLFSLQGLSVIAWWRAARGKRNRFFYIIGALLYLIPMGQITLGVLGFMENMLQIRKIGG